MLNRKELFHRDLPSEEQKANTNDNPTEQPQPTENSVANDTRYIRNPRPRILSNDFVAAQNSTGSNRRNLITDPVVNPNVNRRGGSQKKDTCNTVKIVKGKSLTIKSEKEVIDGKFKEKKSSPNNNQNAKVSTESDSSADSNKRLKFIKDLVTLDENGKPKSVLPGSSCCKNRTDKNSQNAQVKLVSNNLNWLGPIKLTNTKNDNSEGPMLNQLFNNLDNRGDSKVNTNLPTVNDFQNKKLFTM